MKSYIRNHIWLTVIQSIVTVLTVVSVLGVLYYTLVIFFNSQAIEMMLYKIFNASQEQTREFDMPKSYQGWNSLRLFITYSFISSTVLILLSDYQGKIEKSQA